MFASIGNELVEELVHIPLLTLYYLAEGYLVILFIVSTDNYSNCLSLLRDL